MMLQAGCAIGWKRRSNFPFATEPVGDPFQTHLRLLPQPARNLDEPLIAFALPSQTVFRPAQSLQFLWTDAFRLLLAVLLPLLAVVLRPTLSNGIDGVGEAGDLEGGWGAFSLSACSTTPRAILPLALP
jgi:hypothetical protein